MKKIFVLIACFTFFTNVFAQKYVPKVSTGSVMSFDVLATASGQQIPLTLTITSLASPLSMKWDVPGYGTGSFEVSATALESGTKMRISQPQPDKVTKFKDDQTMMVLSKTTFTELVKNQAFELNGTKFTVQTDNVAYKINSKDADVFHAASANGKAELWILNNPDFPLICQIKGNPQGIDYILNTVKE